MRRVTFYRSPAGDSPIERFLDTLSGKQAQRVIWTLRLIEDLDVVPVQYMKKLPGTDDLWEARTQVGGAAFRLLGFMEGSWFVLVHGFEKKTGKTPLREIETATRRKKDHIERRGKS